MKMLNEVYKDKDVEFYSLQVGDGSEDVLAYPEILDITNKITSYDDTLAILQNLDLVVTSCTSVLHASAIIGTETLALIPISEYFPWISPAPERSSVWYGDNLKLFRQVTTRKWDEPIEEMKQYLLNNE
jgi:ADP-heptose:LPS heptosyltransferase